MTRETQGISWMKITRNLTMTMTMTVTAEKAPEEADKVEVDEPAVNRKQPVREDRHAHFATVFSC